MTKAWIKGVLWRFRPQVLLFSLDFCVGAKRNASNVACLLNLNASTLKLNALTLFVMEKDEPFVRREEYAGISVAFERFMNGVSWAF